MKRFFWYSVFVVGVIFVIYDIMYKKPLSNKSYVGYETHHDGMKRRKFLLNKLWRDRAATQLEEEDGAVIHRYILNDAEYKKQLGCKLMEEALEVQTAKTRDELTSEIGDVYEVLDCLIAFHDLSREEIVAKQDKKRKDRGSYLAREYITVAEYLPGSFGESYCLRDPERHIEIFD
jgi:predicted house-cleaning noncanonical NTP pyrophosphatase (MazG superfamily)